MQDRSKVAPTSKKLDPSIPFDTIPACDRQTERQTQGQLVPRQRRPGKRVMAVVSVQDSGAVGPGFRWQPRRCQVTVLGKLFTPVCLCLPSSEMVADLRRVAKVTVGLAESNGRLPPGL